MQNLFKLTNFLFLSISFAYSSEYKFPYYDYESLIQIDAKQCQLNIKNQHVIVQKHYEADVKLLAMQWMGQIPTIDDAQGIYKKLPGLSLQNTLRLRDMYIFEKVSYEILKREKEMIIELGGNAAGNNYNRLQAKSSNLVVMKLKTSLQYLGEMEKTLLAILGFQSVRTNSKANEDGVVKDKYSKDFIPGIYEATYASSEYEGKHNKACMWMHDRVIKKSDPYCGYVWSHGGNFYLERCPGDVHPFGMGHAKSAGVDSVRKLFDFKAVKKCKKSPICATSCFKYCMRKNKFDTSKNSHHSELVSGKCTELADPLYPKQMVKEESLTKKYLEEFPGLPEYYPQFATNDRNEEDVAREIERYYLMTGEYNEEDCRSGKRKFLLEILDAVKQLISLQNNLVKYYSTARDCYVGLAEKIETQAGVGMKHNIRDQKEGANKAPVADRAIVSNSKEEQRPLTEEEQKEANASYFGLTVKEQDGLLQKLIKNGYKFTENELGLICKRSMKKDFCGGSKNKPH